MSTITKEFTKEQLIDQAKKNIEVLRGAAERIPGASDAAVIHLKLAEIALAALTAEPVSVPKDIPDSVFDVLSQACGGGGKACDFADELWNACRAAMLQGAEPVTTAYKLPEGWVAVPIEPTYQMCEAMGMPWDRPRFPDRYKSMIAAAPQREVKNG